MHEELNSHRPVTLELDHPHTTYLSFFSFFVFGYMSLNIQKFSQSNKLTKKRPTKHQCSNAHFARTSEKSTLYCQITPFSQTTDTESPTHYTSLSRLKTFPNHKPPQSQKTHKESIHNQNLDEKNGGERERVDLMQTLRPRYGHFVTLGRRDQAKQRFLRRRAMSFSIEVHFPAKFTASLGIFTGHIIHILGRACVDLLLAVNLFNGGNELEPLAGVGHGGAEETLAAGGGEGVTERSEYEEKEQDYDAKEECCYNV